VVADVVLAEETGDDRLEALRKEVLAECKASLAAHKVPTVIRFVAKLDVTPAGKLARDDA